MVAKSFHRIRCKFSKVKLYTRLMICYTLIFLMVTYVFAFIATSYYTRYNIVKQLQKSMNALNAVNNYYSGKHTALADNILLFYEEENYFIIDGMLNSSTEEVFIDPLKRMKLVYVLQDIADRDEDIEQILLYKNINSSKYVYTKRNNTIERIGWDNPLFNILASWDSGRVITGTGKTIAGFAGNKRQVYGIGGGLRTEDGNTVMGEFLIMFNTKAFNSILQEYSETYGQFLLISTDGDLIFDSYGNYSDGKFPYINTLLSGEESVSIDGQKCYIQTIQRQNSDYIAANIVPEQLLRDSSIPLLIYGVVTLIAVICTGLYMAGGYLITRSLKQLELAMQRIGSNNLYYRIPIVKPLYEFGEIAVKFNKMCDELQETIEREYIGQIKQKKAEFNLLQAGINPHFLYNTLEVIRVKAIDCGNDEVAKMIVDLANLNRAIVKNGAFISIRKEFNICEMYADIFSFRYASSLDYEMDIEPQIMELGIPKNLLQPIIENYFVHGIKNKCNNNRFAIRGFLTEGDICFVFEDNGRGMSKEQEKKINTNIKCVNSETKSGYGLLNVQKRIRLIYGEMYGITLESKEDYFTRITVLIKAMTCSELEANFKSPQRY